MSCEVQRGIQDRMGHGAPPFCLRHAVTGRLADSKFSGETRCAVVHPEGGAQRVRVTRKYQSRYASHETDWGWHVEHCKGMISGCAGGPVFLHSH
jgi:hypothetical protein